MNLCQQLKAEIRSSFTLSLSRCLPGFFPWGKRVGAWFWLFTCSAEVRRCRSVRLLVLYTPIAWTDRTWHFYILCSVYIFIHPLIDLCIWRHKHTHTHTHTHTCKHFQTSLLLCVNIAVQYKYMPTVYACIVNVIYWSISMIIEKRSFPFHDIVLFRLGTNSD